MTHRWTIAALAFTVGCDAATTVSAPSAVRAGVQQVDARIGTGGGGTATLPAGFSLLHFAFTASAGADGSAVGQFQHEYESAGGVVSFQGRVTCMAVEAATGRAWVGGVITQNNSTNPGVLGAIHQPGHDVWFRVVDNGEGSDAAPDRLTVLGFEGGGGIATSAQYCDARLWNEANTWAVASGNIQVRH
jgi:hypothetical protein